MEFLFQKLVVWQKTMDLTQQVYGLVKQFPAEERYALADQLRRAAASVPSNIAEGNGRSGNRDYAHFLSIARGSLYETITQLELAQRLGYIENFNDVAKLAEEVSCMLTSMLHKYGTLEQKN